MLKLKSDFKDQADYERHLISEAKMGNVLARRQLHIEYRPIIAKIIREGNYMRGNIPIESVQLELHERLDDYIDTLDLSNPVKPSTYLMGNMQNKVKRYVAEHQNDVRIPETYHWDVGRFQSAQDDLAQSLNRHPELHEIHFRMNEMFAPPGKNQWSMKDVERIQKSIRKTIQGSSVIGNQDEAESLTAADLAFVDDVDPLTSYREQLMVQQMMNDIQELPEPHRTVIKHYHGVGGHEQLSLRQLALKLGTNKYQVGKYYEEAKNMLKQKE